MYLEKNTKMLIIWNGVTYIRIIRVQSLFIYLLLVGWTNEK